MANKKKHDNGYATFEDGLGFREIAEVLHEKIYVNVLESISKNVLEEAADDFTEGLEFKFGFRKIFGFHHWL